MTLTDEELWESVYGIAYTTKWNVVWQDRIPFLRTIMAYTKARTILDVGTNAGWNLRAFQAIDDTLGLQGVEINNWVAQAATAMGFSVFVGSARAVCPRCPNHYDMVVTSGMLIHVPPDLLTETMQAIITASKRWVLAVEYASDVETVIVERAGAPRTWARPYGKHYEDLGLKLAGEGEASGYIDCHWWLMEKA